MSNQRKQLSAGEVFEIGIPGGKIIITPFGRCDVDLVLGPPDIINNVPVKKGDAAPLPTMLEIGYVPNQSMVMPGSGYFTYETPGCQNVPETHVIYDAKAWNKLQDECLVDMGR